MSVACARMTMDLPGYSLAFFACQSEEREERGQVASTKGRIGREKTSVPRHRGLAAADVGLRVLSSEGEPCPDGIREGPRSQTPSVERQPSHVGTGVLTNIPTRRRHGG